MSKYFEQLNGALQNSGELTLNWAQDKKMSWAHHKLP